MASPQAFAAVLKARAQRLEKAVMDAEAQTLAEAQREARRLSSGPYSLPGLRKAGHPFSRRAPNGAFNPAVIHAGGGRGTWRASFKTAGPKKQGGDVISVLRNTDSVGRYLTGTKRMIDRWGPQKAAIVKAVAPRRLRRLKKAAQTR